jgi:streptogramin lyase
VVQRIAVGNGPSGVAGGYGSVWVANSSDGTLSRIDATTGVVAKPIALGGGATDVAAGYRAVWVSDEAGGRVLRVEPQIDHVTDSLDDARADRDHRRLRLWWRTSMGRSRGSTGNQPRYGRGQVGGPDAIAAGAGSVWVANEFGRSVALIDRPPDGHAGDRGRQ